MVIRPSRCELNKATLFEDLGYFPHDGQWLVHQSTASRRVLACGVRWGKSTCAAMEMVAALLEPRRQTLGWIVAPTYDLTDRVFLVTVRVFEQHLAHRVREYLPRERILTIRNLGGGTSRLIAKSADNPTSLLGEGLDFVVIDEAAQLARIVWEQYLMQRLVDRQGWALFLSTPRGKGWFHSLYRRGQDRRMPTYESWRSPTWTNPHLDREIIEAERVTMSHEAFAQEFEAVFVGVGAEPCFICGGPSAHVSGLVVMKAGREIPKCAECGEPVNDSGKTIIGLGTGGQPRLKRIIFPDDGLPGAFVNPLPALSVLEANDDDAEAQGTTTPHS